MEIAIISMRQNSRILILKLHFSFDLITPFSVIFVLCNISYFYLKICIAYRHFQKRFNVSISGVCYYFLDCAINISMPFRYTSKIAISTFFFQKVEQKYWHLVSVQKIIFINNLDTNCVKIGLSYSGLEALYLFEYIERKENRIEQLLDISYFLLTTCYENDNESITKIKYWLLNGITLSIMCMV